VCVLGVEIGVIEQQKKNREAAPFWTAGALVDAAEVENIAGNIVR
jgi:hypothetical protein